MKRATGRLWRHRAALLLVSGSLSFVSRQASAYCRTTTCDQEGAPSSCGTPPANGCNTQGIPIAWPSTCVSTSVSAYGSPAQNISADEMRSIVAKAFENWTTADCGNGTPNFQVDMFPDVNCTDVGYKTTGPNYNIWIFHDTDWPYGNVDESAIALTTTQFAPDTGIIYDSDVELNSEGQTFTTGLDVIGMDLPSVVQHESGHFLGLAHSTYPTATMYAYLDAGDASLRTLDPDDVDAICATYPPGNLDPTCDPEPRHGFSTECEFDKGCCTVAPGHRNRRAGLALVAAGLVLAAALRRRGPLVAARGK